MLDEVDKINLGLMLFTPGPGSTPSGAYVRFHVRPMLKLNPTNINAMKQLIGSDSGCANGSNARAACLSPRL